MNKEIYQTIKKRILFMEYAPGQILNEKVLAKEFGVSRTPLREVLNKLEWEQLAKIFPRTGTMVAEIEFQKIMNAFQVRLEIEGLVGKLAAEQADDEHLEQLRIIQDECSQLSSRKNKTDLANIDLKFREILHDAVSNPVLKDISYYLYNLTVRLWYVTLDKGDWAEEVQTLLDEIDQTREVLYKKEPQKAYNLRRDFLITHLERIRRKFSGFAAL
ncbi:MAG: GntR family transcriptional regulator [Desulfobacterales bacterium]|nr:GntR family transcriptional regulator [Desulfobacterales bacterium]